MVDADLNALYSDDKYNEYLVKLAGQNLLSFDDFRQEVFLYLSEHTSDARKSAKRIAMRMRRSNIKLATVSLDQIGEVSESDGYAMLWEDRHVFA
jgi:hypothetical protein